MHSKKLICDILDYIDNNINKEISIDELSNIFYFDKTYIMKLFKKEIKVTIIEYINKMRIYNSLNDFKNNKQIIYIALNNGFTSLEYFSETFKHILKVSPREYKYFLKRDKNISLDKILNIQLNLANLQYLKDKATKYKNNKPIPKNQTKKLSLFK